MKPHSTFPTIAIDYDDQDPEAAPDQHAGKTGTITRSGTWNPRHWETDTMERGADTANDIPATPTEAVADYLWEQRHEVLYRSRLSAMYHRRRERFYDWMDRAATAIALFAGSAAFAASANPATVQVAGALVTLATAVALVFGFADKARRHATLADSYKRIEADIYRAGDYDYSEAQLNGWRAQVAQAESGEPPTLRPLVVLCQNDLAIAARQFDKLSPLPWHQRMLAHFIDFDVPFATAP